MSDWISVKDKLPSGDDPVLGVRIRTVIDITTRRTDTFCEYLIVEYEPFVWEEWNQGRFYQLPMDYWMPLPEPPEEGGSN